MPMGASASTLAQQKQLSSSQTSLKSIPDYDSSATVSADEGPHQQEHGGGGMSAVWNVFYYTFLWGFAHQNSTSALVR